MQKGLITLITGCMFQKIALLCPLILCTFFHDFIHVHVHSPSVGTDNQLGPNVWCQQEYLIILVICCKFQNNLFNLWLYTPSDFIHTVHDLINVYSRRSVADNPQETKFWCQQKPLATSVICYKFHKNLLEVWTHFFMILYMYTAPGQGWQPLGDEIFMSTGTSCHFGHLLQVSKNLFDVWL